MYSGNMLNYRSIKINKNKPLNHKQLVCIIIIHYFKFYNEKAATEMHIYGRYVTNMLIRMGISGYIYVPF